MRQRERETETERPSFSRVRLVPDARRGRKRGRAGGVREAGQARGWGADLRVALPWMFYSTPACDRVSVMYTCMHIYI